MPFEGTNFYLLPFADHVYVRETLQDDSIKNMEDAVRAQLATVKATMNPDEVNILIAHGYVIQAGNDTSEPSDSERPLSIGTSEYVDVSLFEDFDYVASGASAQSPESQKRQSPLQRLDPEVFKIGNPASKADEHRNDRKRQIGDRTPPHQAFARYAHNQKHIFRVDERPIRRLPVF